MPAKPAPSNETQCARSEVKKTLRRIRERRESRKGDSKILKLMTRLQRQAFNEADLERRAVTGT